MIAAELWALLVAPAALHAHGVLQRSTPADGARLAEVPRELRLTFNEAVELAVARIELASSDSAPVLLGVLRHGGDSARVVVADILVPLGAGRYTVAWQVVGKDGHPVRGTFAFTIAPGARGVAATDTGRATVPPALAPQPVAPERQTRPMGIGEHHGFDAESPLYALVRWANYMGLVALIGAVAFAVVVVRRAAVPALAWGVMSGAQLARAAASVGTVAALLVLAGALLRLTLQSVAMNGGGDALDRALVAAMVGETTWGVGWLLQLTGGLVALVGARVARRVPNVGWTIAGAGAVTVAFAAALSSHAASAARLAPVAVASDTLHILGAGGWLGSLLLLVVVGVPAAARAEIRARGATIAALVNAFSPVALACAALVAATGLIAAWLQLGAFSALWETRYGRILLLKVGALALVAAIGAYNWLKLKPAVGDHLGPHRLRRTATMELAVGAIVLAVTAVLVATPPPTAVG